MCDAVAVEDFLPHSVSFLSGIQTLNLHFQGVSHIENTIAHHTLGLVSPTNQILGCLIQLSGSSRSLIEKRAIQCE